MWSICKALESENPQILHFEPNISINLILNLARFSFLSVTILPLRFAKYFLLYSGL